MNILVVPDSFKDSLSARKVAENIEKGIRRLKPDAKVSKIPISDGGEGLLDSLIDDSGGRILSVEVKNPLLRTISAEFGILGDETTAVIEMAKASGLELLDDHERNPLISSTFGTGQLIRAALDKGCSKIIVGLGGSATNDGGTGMIRALGGKFLDVYGNEIWQGGGGLDKLAKIDISKIDPRIAHCEFIAACDVTNPLTGPLGASIVFGKQKGGTTHVIRQLDQNLKHYAQVVLSSLKIDIDSHDGAGAAGGMGAAMLGFFDAKLVRGIDLIVETLQLEEQVKKADLIITGEGRIDRQTLYGKTISGIAGLAKKHKVPAIAICGTMDDDIEGIYELGINAIYSIIDKPMSLEEARKKAPQLIRSSVENIMRTLAT